MGPSSISHQCAAAEASGGLDTVAASALSIDSQAIRDRCLRKWRAGFSVDSDGSSPGPGYVLELGDRLVIDLRDGCTRKLCCTVARSAGAVSLFRKSGLHSSEVLWTQLSADPRRRSESRRHSGYTEGKLVSRKVLERHLAARERRTSWSDQRRRLAENLFASAQVASSIASTVFIALRY
jgi:hypothetical protein